MNYEDIKNPIELLKFMDNIEYGWINKNNKIVRDDTNFYNEYFLQSPNQLLISKHGVCWDQVELERDWFLKHNYKIKTFFLWFEVDYKNKFPTHTFLVYEKDNKYYWFEHSFSKHRGIHEYESYELLVEDVKLKHLEYSISIDVAAKDDYSLLKMYEYSTPKYGSSVSEYIKFVSNN